MPQSLLIIDDEPEVRRLLEKFFQQQGYATLTAADAETGLRLARSRLPTLIVSDIHLPKMSGIEACQALKRDDKTSSIPILMITGNDKQGQEVICLQLGADDYLTKPFEMPMILAHVQALLRRGPYLGTKPQAVEKEGIALDLARKIVTLDGEPFPHLTPKEFDLLYHLVINEGTPSPRATLYQKAWGTPPVDKSVLRTVDVHVQRVRAKLRLGRAKRLVAVTGRGYMWSRPA